MKKIEICCNRYAGKPRKKVGKRKNGNINHIHAGESYVETN